MRNVGNSKKPIEVLIQFTDDQTGLTGELSYLKYISDIVNILCSMTMPAEYMSHHVTPPTHLIVHASASSHPPPGHRQYLNNLAMFDLHKKAFRINVVSKHPKAVSDLS